VCLCVLHLQLLKQLIDFHETCNENSAIRNNQKQPQASHFLLSYSEEYQHGEIANLISWNDMAPYVLGFWISVL